MTGPDPITTLFPLIHTAPPSIRTMPPTRSSRFHGSAPPNMLEGNSIFSHASGFTINGGTFNINPQQPPPVILSPPNSPSWGGGSDWAGYIAHLEARLAALEAVVNLNPRTPAMEDIFNPYNQPEYGDHVRATEFNSRDMDAMDRGDVVTVDVSGDWLGHTTSDASDRCSCSGCSFDSCLPKRSMVQTEDVPEDMRDAGAAGVGRLQPEPAAVSDMSQALTMPKPVGHRPDPLNVERTSVELPVAPHSLTASEVSESAASND
ncbi:hypothetical protein DFH09DRAFT_1377186 [Mycena vulgaris]|nr:hypothetical protein DFH09DRAFT_1377186 [Mycena vulgaris]